MILTSMCFKFKDLFYYNRYLRLTYTTTDETEDTIDFGSVFLILGDVPTSMVGKIVGYGSISQTLISGTMQLEKVKRN